MIDKIFSISYTHDSKKIKFCGLKFNLGYNLFDLQPDKQAKICKLVFDISIRKGTSDINVVEDILVNKVYECLNTNNEINTIIDAGANIGCASVYFAQKYPNAKIYALEPEKENFEYLVKNTKKYKNVIPLNIGLWGYDTNLAVVDNGYGKWGFQTVESEVNNSTECKSINSLIKQFNIDKIDILKMDIEGAEKSVFEHDENFDYSKIETICLELHDRMQEGCSNALFKSISKHTEYLLFGPYGENLVFNKSKILQA